MLSEAERREKTTECIRENQVGIKHYMATWHDIYSGRAPSDGDGGGGKYLLKSDSGNRLK